MLLRSARFLLGIALVAALCAGVWGAEIPVEGVVLGTEGYGLPGARLELRPVVSRYEAGGGELEGRGEPAPVARAVAGFMGRFRLSAPRTGLWRVVAVADGYVPMEISVLPVVEETSLPPVVLRTDSGLRVRVVDADGNPVAGARVLGQTGRTALWSSADWQPCRRLAVSGPDGQLRLARAALEPLRLWAAGPGFPAQGGIVADGREAVLRLQPGKPRLLLPRDAALDAENRPLPEALLRDPRSSLVLGRFDGQHPLALPAPAAGLWDLRVELADGRRMVFRIDQAQEAQRTAETSPILLRLTAAVALAGRIVDAGGRHALPGALVWPADDPGSLKQTDAAGAYRLAGRVPGSRCELRAAAAGYKPGQLKVGLPSRSPESLRKAPDLPLVFSPVPAVLGVVVDEADRPVAGAEVRLVRPDPEVIGGPPESRLATTAPDGGFRIAPLQPGGLYTLTASRTGFAPATRFVTVAPPRRSSPPLRLALTRGRTASGLVLDSRQRPIPGATVKLTPPILSHRLGEDPEPEPCRAATGPDGRFQVTGLPVGFFELRIEGPELAPLPMRMIAVPKGAGLLDLGTFTLEGRPRIAGWIVEPGGRPVEGVEIWVVAEHAEATPQAARREGPAAVTGRDGRFELRDRPVGDHEKLRACRQGYLPEEFSVPATEPQIVLTPATRLAGRVTSVEGAPLPGARVSASLSGQEGGDLILPHPPCPFDNMAALDADGNFNLALPAPGRYDVTAWCAGHLATRLEHLLVPPEGLDGVEIRMAGGTVVTGHLSDPQGHAVAGASISFSGPSSYVKTASDSGGDYLLEGVGPGAQSVLIEHPDFETATAEVQVPAEGTRFDLTLHPAPHLEIRGRVSGPDGAPVEGAVLSLSCRCQKTSTEADGSFVLTVGKGAYKLLVEKDGFAPVETASVTVQDRSVDGVEIQLSYGMTLTGRVLGAAPAAVDKVVITLLSVGFLDREAPVDAEGRFEVANLPPGEWSLFAQAGDRIAFARFTPPGGQAEVVHDLQLPPISEIRGRVTGPAGEPIAGASLWFHGSPGQTLRANTLADGSFAVGVTDGTYTMNAMAEGYSSRDAERPIVIAGAPVDDVEIQLGTNVVLTGRLLGLERGGTLRSLEVIGPSAYRPDGWTVDLEGNYRLMGLSPGDWTLKGTFGLGAQERSAMGRVHIPPGATTATLDLDFRRKDLTSTNPAKP